MRYLRWLLFPFSLIYGLVVVIRNWCYDAGFFKVTQFDLPVISVGNLDVGGAGKSPMTEYLIRLLQKEYQPAVLSRGYGRDTKGFIIADATTTANQVGDEPAQFKQKFSDVTIAVCENRVKGIDQLKNEHDLILLDDAFQHRAVKPGLSILLLDYYRLKEPHLLLPAGNLREPYSGRWRADIIVITKSPVNITQDEQNISYMLAGPLSWQPVFFTAISYLPLQDMAGALSGKEIDADTTVFLLTGIANANPLIKHIKSKSARIVHHHYPDHHRFSLKNIAKLAVEFAACISANKLIITTEKDAQRLRLPLLQAAVTQLPIWVLPIGIKFLDEGQQQFNQLIQNHVREHTKHH